MVVNQEGVESEIIEADGLAIQLPATWVHMLCYLYILQYVNTKFTGEAQFQAKHCVVS